jgi:hypothetical protein
MTYVYTFNGYIYASDGVYLYCLDPKKMKK